MCTDADIGFGLLDRWSKSGQTAATDEPRVLPWQKRSKARSVVHVHSLRQHNHTGDDSFYVVENLYVNPSKRIRVVDWPTGGPKLSIQRGAFRVACRPAATWSTATAPLTLADIKRALAFGPLPSVQIDTVPTLFVTRDGVNNIFHAMADVINAYLMRQIFPYERIVFLDDLPDGPLMALFRLLSERPPQRFRELGAPRIMAHAMFSPPGGCCFLWKNFGVARDECRHPSTLLQAFRAFVLERLHLGCGPSSSGRRVTLIRRTRPMRRIANEGALAAALAASGADVEVIDFAGLGYEAQIAKLRETSVLLGAHGAGLTNLLWLDTSAAAVELFGPSMDSPACYGNIATWCGIDYAAWHSAEVAKEIAGRGPTSGEFEVDVDAVVALVVPRLRFNAPTLSLNGQTLEPDDRFPHSSK